MITYVLFIPHHGHFYRNSNIALSHYPFAISPSMASNHEGFNISCLLLLQLNINNVIAKPQDNTMSCLLTLPFQLAHTED